MERYGDVHNINKLSWTANQKEIKTKVFATIKRLSNLDGDDEYQLKDKEWGNDLFSSRTYMTSHNIKSCRQSAKKFREEDSDSDRKIFWEPQRN